MYLNRQEIIGRITKDPVLKQTSNGTPYVTFSVAVQRAFTPEGKERITDFFDVVAWGSRAEYINKYYKKGNLVYIAGENQSRVYEAADGSKRKTWNINVSETRLLEKRNALSEEDESEGEVNGDPDIIAASVPDVPF